MILDRADLRRAVAYGRLRVSSLGATLWVVAAAALVAALTAVALRATNGPPSSGSLVPVGVLIGVSYPAVGAMIARRHPRNPIGWIFCVIGLTQAFAEFSFQYATYTLVTRPGALGGGPAMAWFSDWLWFPGYALILTFTPLLFPDGRLPSRRWRPVAWTAAAALVLVVAAAVSAVPLQSGRLSVGEPLEGEATAELLGGLGFSILLPAALLSVLSLFFRWRGADQSERQRIKWFLFAAVVAVSLLVTSNFFEGSPYVVLQTVGATVLPIGAGIAILKYRLYDVDVVINRSLVYALMTGAVVVGYVAVVAAVEALFARAGIEASLVGAGVVAVAFQPLRERVQRAVNRLLHGDRDDPYAVLSALGRGLEAAGRPDQLLPAVTASISDALRLPYVGIELRSDGSSRITASSGVRRDDVEAWPLIHHGEDIGRLIVAPRSSREELSIADRRVLDDIARQVSVAAYALLVSEDLQRSRERLRTALEEERRRIRRDLHDGLGPSLATVVVGIEEARNRLITDPAAGDALLRDLKGQTQTAINDIRALVYDLRPPVLDEMGLVPAIRELAARFAHAGDLDVHVDASDDLPVLPAAVEVAAFRVVQEAITNVLKHASASRCDVRVLADDDLLIEVSDDGVGATSPVHAGVGIRSMRERAGELGGSVSISFAGDGGNVSIRFPLGRS